MRAVRWAGTVFFVSLLGVGSLARAQTGEGLPPLPRLDRSFDVQLFHPAVGAASYVTLDSADVLEHRLWHFALVTNYARRPFSYTLSDKSGVSSVTSKVVPVENLATAELVAAVGIRNRFELGAALPVAMTWGGDSYGGYGSYSGSASSVVGLGDLRVEGKSELMGFGADRAVVLSLSAGATIPTGDDSAFLGEKTFTGRVRALLEYQRSDRVRGLVMAGGMVRGRSEFLGTPESHALLYGAAVEVKPESRIGVIAEVRGRVASGYYDANPAEADVALRFSMPSMLHLVMGAGMGLNRGIGSPLARGFVGLGWAPDYRDRDRDGILDIDDRCPDEPEDYDGVQDDDGCPDPDNDGDGIPDVVDKCPNELEDKDGFQDEDGCPDLDNDGDGLLDINDACPNDKEDGKGKRPTDGCPSSGEDSDGDGVPDVKDKCPEEPEDKDGFEDDDGCPDYDNDNDGIPDAYDACPNQAEDFDGFEDTDGCPEPDNDHDGISDTKDRCPNQPETYDNFRDEDGCPDGTPLVSLGDKDSKVFLGDRITFHTGAGVAPVLSPNSRLLVELLAKVIKGHAEVALLRIEVRGKDLSKEATEERGRVVVEELVKNGVEAQRLKVAGLGAGHNRVDIVVESRTKPKPVPTPAPAPSHEPSPSPGPPPSPEEPPSPEPTAPSSPEPGLDSPGSDLPDPDLPDPDLPDLPSPEELKEEAK